MSFFLGGAEYFREDEFFIQSILDGCDAEPSFQTALKVEQVIAQVRDKAGEHEHTESAAGRG